MSGFNHYVSAPAKPQTLLSRIGHPNQLLTASASDLPKFPFSLKPTPKRKAEDEPEGSQQPTLKARCKPFIFPLGFPKTEERPSAAATSATQSITAGRSELVTVRDENTGKLSGAYTAIFRPHKERRVVSAEGSKSAIASAPNPSIMHLTLEEINQKITSLQRLKENIKELEASKRSAQASEFAVPVLKHENQRLKGKVVRSETNRLAAEAKTAAATKDLADKEAMWRRDKVARKKELETMRLGKEAAEAQLSSARCDLQIKQAKWRAANEISETRHRTMQADRDAEVKKRKDAVSAMEEAKKGREEAENKLAMIREAHDRERAMYLKHIKELEGDTKVKVKEEGSSRK